ASHGRNPYREGPDRWTSACRDSRAGGCADGGARPRHRRSTEIARDTIRQPIGRAINSCVTPARSDVRSAPERSALPKNRRLVRIETGGQVIRRGERQQSSSRAQVDGRSRYYPSRILASLSRIRALRSARPAACACRISLKKLFRCILRWNRRPFWPESYHSESHDGSRLKLQCINVGLRSTRDLFAESKQ